MPEAAAGQGSYPTLHEELSAQLPNYLAGQRWFGGKARTIRAAELVDVVPVPIGDSSASSGGPSQALVLIVAVSYTEGPSESYAIPIVRAEQQIATAIDSARLKISGAGGGFELVDALKEGEFLTTLLQLIDREETLRGEKGELRATKTSAYQTVRGTSGEKLAAKPVGAEQSNTSIIYGNKLILKFFRRVEEGVNPDLEIGAFLTEKARFEGTPQVAGSLRYVSRDGKESAQGILQTFVANQGDAWSYTLKSLDGFYEAARTAGTGSNAGADAAEKTELVAREAGEFLKSAALLGRRTAEMHLALASNASDPAFAPEPFTPGFQAQLEQSIQQLSSRVFGQLREKSSGLPHDQQDTARRISTQETEIAKRVHAWLSKPIHATRTRIHGDYHLGQVLYTGSDFVIIDFEGEPARPLAERRIKRSPLQDVAGMLRSFHYAAFAPLLTPNEKNPSADQLSVEKFGSWAEGWNATVSETFLGSYFQTAGKAAYLPERREEIRVLLDLHLLEKAVYELGYELNNRPTWVGIPLQGISRLLSI
jgi:maltose alpha-D-glucosyltransferase / alpha-amylase